MHVSLSGFSGICPIVLAAALIVSPATAQNEISEAELGAKLYNDHCASCHGDNGRGHGPVAYFLNVPPADLTQISNRNEGQFPFLEVFHIIDGRTEARAHGTALMPVWGDSFKAQAGQVYGPFGAEPYVRERITAVTKHIESIQDE